MYSAVLCKFMNKHNNTWVLESNFIIIALKCNCRRRRNSLCSCTYRAASVTAVSTLTIILLFLSGVSKPETKKWHKSVQCQIENPIDAFIYLKNNLTKFRHESTKTLKKQCCCPRGKSLSSRIVEDQFSSPCPCPCP